MATFQSDLTVLGNGGGSMTAYGEPIEFAGAASDVAIAARIVAQLVPGFGRPANTVATDLVAKLLIDMCDKLQAHAEQWGLDEDGTPTPVRYAATHRSRKDGSDAMLVGQSANGMNLEFENECGERWQDSATEWEAI